MPVPDSPVSQEDVATRPRAAIPQARSGVPDKSAPEPAAPDTSSPAEVGQGPREARTIYERVFAALGQGIVIHDSDGRIIEANKASELILGLTTAQMAGKTPVDTSWRTIHADGSDFPGETHPAMVSLVTGKPVRDVIMGVHKPDGDLTWILVNSEPIPDEHGKTESVATSFTDITKELTVHKKLADAERFLRSALDAAPQGMAIVSLDLRIQQVNSRLCELVARDEKWLLAHTIHDLMSPDDHAADLAARESLFSGASRAETLERKFLTGDGRTIWVIHSIGMSRDETDEPDFYVSQIQDLTNTHQIQQELASRADHDPLTSLANRDLLSSHLTKILGQYSQDVGTPAALLCDLDNFRLINNTHGHTIGDRILKTIADRIVDGVGPKDVVARLNGDEFVVVLESATEETANECADMLRSAVGRPISLEGDETITLTMSVGIVLATPGQDANRLLRDADIALYSAKNSGRNRARTFDGSPDATIAVRMKNSLDRGEFIPWFQPIVDMHDEGLAGYEALVRRIRPDGSVSDPDSFLRDAERTNLITEIDFEILRKSAEMVRGLREGNFIAVNVSANTLSSDGYAERVLEVLEATGADPAKIHLEFTETSILNASDKARQSMTTLADVGLRWYVDDFGTGYSSISHLRDLPISGLKLDRSFTMGLGQEDQTCDHLAQALAGLAAGLGLDTVAEGVETREQASILRAQGWEHGQGRLFGSPKHIDPPQ